MAKEGAIIRKFALTSGSREFSSILNMGSRAFRTEVALATCLGQPFGVPLDVPLVKTIKAIWSGFGTLACSRRFSSSTVSSLTLIATSKKETQSARSLLGSNISFNGLAMPIASMALSTAWVSAGADTTTAAGFSVFK